MNLHKELNRLQQQLTTETIGGASVYGVRENDRPLITAFMNGVNQTRELKFDHPGLGTTATHSGERLVIRFSSGSKSRSCTRRSINSNPRSAQNGRSGCAG